MTQDAPLCRFCWDTKNGKRNPLIEPCECKGSMRFVHVFCLQRWRNLNPVRNGRICLLCMEPYHEEYNRNFEAIPDTSSLSSFLLRFPFLVFVTVNYIGVFTYSLSIKKPNIPTHFCSYQYYSQIAYFLLFFMYWKVKDKRRYWRHWNQVETYCFIMFHTLCNVYLYEEQTVAIIPLVFLLGHYWPKHVSILERMNRE
jgi:hypothetical protein